MLSPKLQWWQNSTICYWALDNRPQIMDSVVKLLFFTGEVALRATSPVKKQQI
jgi:hypothetical protein